MSEQETIYSYILKQIQAGELSKQVAAHLIHYLKQEQQSKPAKVEQDIAIVGTSSRIASATGATQFTHLLARGVDAVRDIPATRKEQADLFLPLLQLERDQAVYDHCGYLDEIDGFDPEFFDMSPRESALMDPHQRLFLQTAWEAVEDAGYSPLQMAGSNTGVFIGHSTDFGEEYKKGIQLIAPESAGLALPGNIKSIIASRISYLLDLKGPAMVIDTACSSSLVAVHFACRQLLDGRCDLAIAGGIKLNLFPLKGSVYSRIGVESSDERTRTFDDSSSGTGKGEGAGVIVLKPLGQALKDRDHIYGVIKGSAINQDGHSIGITAPDSHAQEEVICQAWKEAGIDPETITYVETHGTGTKLGDPIELEGLTRAFKRFTHKSQFCAVGSLKTNIGHLDHASGIAGLLKVIHSLKEKKLFPSLHFNYPNRNIDFSPSPVYVNDRLQDWTVTNMPRTAGISSFGLSGTNCHMVVQEAPSPPVTGLNINDINNRDEDNNSALYLLPLSAKREDVLNKLIQDYISFLHGNAEVNLDNLCYTASSGRGHYSHRLAIVFTDYADLMARLQAAVQQQSTSPGASAGRLAGRNQEELTRQADELINTGTETAGAERNLEVYGLLAELYMAGATIHWDKLYADQEYSRISLPVYPFRQIRCWVEGERQAKEQRKRADFSAEFIESTPHSRNASESPGKTVHISRLSADRDWELNEHRIGTSCVLPGTAYIERLSDIASRQGEMLTIRNLAFLQPFRLRPGETGDLHFEMNGEGNERRFMVSSKEAGDGAVLLHAEGKLESKALNGKPERVDLNALKAAYPARTADETGQEAASTQEAGTEQAAAYITTGIRWDNISEVAVKDGACLVKLRLPDSCLGDLEHHHCHPALLDNAVNIAIRSLDQDLYLPFYYGELRLYGSIPSEFYSEVIRRTEEGTGAAQTATFDIRLLSPAGDVLAEIQEYTIKKVSGNSLPDAAGQPSPSFRGYVRDWVIKEPRAVPVDPPASASAGETVLLLQGDGAMSEKLAVSLRTRYTDIVEVPPERLRTREDYLRLAKEIRAKRISLIVHALGLTEQEVEEPAALDEAQTRGYDSLYHLLNSLYPVNDQAAEEAGNQHADSEQASAYLEAGAAPGHEPDGIRILIVTDYAHPVTDAEARLLPQHGCILGLGKVAREEYTRVDIRCIDLDDATPPEAVLRELALTEAPYQVAYRSGQRYVERLSEQTLAPANPLAPVIRENGVYIITGGTGGLGLQVGQWLSRQSPVHLHLISRSGLQHADVEATGSAGLDEANGTGAAVTKRSRQSAAVAAMRSHGAQVFSHAVDISDMEAMRSVIDEIHNLSGKINGVIHCAGVAGEGLLWDKPVSRMQEVLDAKVKGTRVLDQATIEDELDFLLMFSSITSLTGGMGQGDYSAANSYLDAYGSYMQHQGRKGLTVNWPLWQGAGMAEDYGVHEDKGLFASIPPERGTGMLEVILNAGLPRIITGELNPQAAIESISTSLLNDYVLSDKLSDFFSRLGGKASGVPERLNKSDRSVIITDAEFTDLSPQEKELAVIWSDVLGLDHIAVHEKFNSMGGNSIFAIDLFRQLEKTYGSLLNVSDVFTYATISEMAQFIAGKQKPMKNTPAPEATESAEAANAGEADTFELLKRLANQDISVQEAVHIYKK